MPVESHTYTARVLGAGQPIELDVTRGDLGLDEGWAPHVQGNLTCALPPEATLDLIDWRKGLRVEVTATRTTLGSSTGISRTFDLALVGRVADHNAGTMDLELASEEVLLQADELVSATANVAAFDHQHSLRSIINNVVLSRIGAQLQPGPTDAPFRVLTDAVQMFENASIESTGVGKQAWAGTRVATIRSTAWASDGGASVRMYNPGDVDSFATLGGDLVGGDMKGMKPGGTYTVSRDFRIAAPLGGNAHVPRARAIVVFWITPRGTTEFAGKQAPNVPGVTRQVLTFTLPADASAVAIRFYHGHTAGESWTDAVRLSENSGEYGEDLDKFFDGDTPDTEEYSYQWDGIPKLSPSRRIALMDRSPDLLRWEPGTSAWDFIQPIFQAAGFRLWCDELRRWWLTDVSHAVPGQARISEGYNLTRASEILSRSASDNDWFDAVVVKYTWKDSETAETRTAYDVASTPGHIKPTYIEIDAPYPGPGYAAYALRRAAGKGRTLRVSAISDYAVSPGMEALITVPDIPIQAGVVSSVRWDLSSDEMDIGTRGLTDAPPSSWRFLPVGERWMDSPVGATWSNEKIGA